MRLIFPSNCIPITELTELILFLKSKLFKSFFQFQKLILLFVQYFLPTPTEPVI